MAARTTSTPQARLADAALRALAKKPWQEISLREIAKAAKVTMAEMQTLAPSKPALIGLILQRLNEKVTAGHQAEDDAPSARERLFDIGMVWFDTLAKHKPAIRALYEGLKFDPLTLLAAGGEFVSAAQWLMTLADADRGPALPLRAAGFAAILAHTIPAWLEDDGDLTKTMARLDGDLRRAENMFGRPREDP